MKIDEINDYYRRNPPKIIMDDLGIFHEIEVPLPAKYKRRPCSCGIIHKWENPKTFYLDEFIISPSVFPKKIKVCETCSEIIVLELLNDS